ncbi:hypothetical protein F5887DRAFT_565891 [Amanita rubescens]|nr:hypothetical protein F5887DRAFT_565891 [Amanita rubescens]
MVFPGGILPSLTLLLNTLETGLQGQLVVDSVTNIGPHYARALREWRHRFMHYFETVIAPNLPKRHGRTVRGEGQRRNWGHQANMDMNPPLTLGLRPR